MRLLIFFISLAILLYGLFRPESPPYLFENADKIMHFLAFGAISLVARITFLRAPAWLLWGLLLAFAFLSEWFQHRVQPTRGFSWLDIASNTLGVVLAAIGWWILTLLYKRWKNRNAN